MFEASVIAHNKAQTGKELTTFQLRYPKFIHGEFLTHRVFSRNSSSSRAIPFKKLLEDIERDMAMPIYWGKNQPGMQAREEIEQIDEAIRIWKEAFQSAKKHAIEMYELGVHKQTVNRLIEPFCFINTVVTSTEWDNWYELRAHPDAQPEINHLANLMLKAFDIRLKAARNSVEPKILQPGDWHLPYVKEKDWVELAQFTRSDQKIISLLLKVSTARCARTSYLTHEMKVPKLSEDCDLYDKLVVAKPIHASPCEHQGTPDILINEVGLWAHQEYHGNFDGFIQNRKLVEQGIVDEFLGVISHE